MRGNCGEKRQLPRDSEGSGKSPPASPVLPFCEDAIPENFKIRTQWQFDDEDEDFEDVECFRFDETDDDDACSESSDDEYAEPGSTDDKAADYDIDALCSLLSASHIDTPQIAANPQTPSSPLGSMSSMAAAVDDIQTNTLVLVLHLSFLRHLNARAIPGGDQPIQRRSSRHPRRRSQRAVLRTRSTLDPGGAAPRRTRRPNASFVRRIPSSTRPQSWFARQEHRSQLHLEKPRQRQRHGQNTSRKRASAHSLSRILDAHCRTCPTSARATRDHGRRLRLP